MADNNYEIDVTLEETFGTGVRSVEQTATSAESGGLNEITVTLTNDQENKFYIMNGLAGKDGRDGGFPVAVGEASLMTDTSKIYLYVGIEEGYTQNHLYYWDGEAWHDYGTYGAPAEYLRSASVTYEQGLDQLGNTTYTANTLTLEGNADGSPVETEFVQKLYYSAGENVDGALTQKATSEAIESAQYLPIVNHPNVPVEGTALSVELQQNVMNVIGGVGYSFTTITMTLATKKAGKINRYFGRFTTGGNAIAVTWPTGVTVPSALSYKTQTTYDFVIEDSILHVWEDGNAVGDVLDATATANAVSTWLTNHPEATTTVADGSITTVKLASGVIDSTLTVQGAAADAKKTGDEISDLKSEVSDIEEQIEGGTGTGMSADFKVALDSFMTAMLTLADNVAYDDDTSGDSIYSDIETAKNAVHSAMYPPANLKRIDVTYTPVATIYVGDSLDKLRDDLVVTAVYDNGSSTAVSDYVLSGTLTEGTSAVTATWGGKSATFNVTVEPAHPLYQWDFTQSNIDIWQNTEYPINSNNAELTSYGIYFKSASSGISGAWDAKIPLGGYAVLEFGDIVNASSSGTNALMFEIPTQFGYRGASRRFSTYYNKAWHDDEVVSITNKNYFNHKLLEIHISEERKVSYVCDGQTIFETTSLTVPDAGLAVILGTYNNNMMLNPMYVKALTIYGSTSTSALNE